MKRKLYIVISLLSVVKVNYGQQNTWDIPATEQMISHNKQNYSDHREIRNNQVLSQATVSTWKKTTNEFKTVSDLIDKRLTSAFVVVSDAGTLYNIFSQLTEMIQYEQKSLAIAKRHPWAVAYLTSQQSQIIESGKDLFNYISLLAISSGEISKMKVSSRKIIFHSIDLQLSVLKARCYSMYMMMKRLDITSEIRNSKPLQIINRDKQIIDNVIKTMK